MAGINAGIMEEKEIIAKIKALREIKPNQEWVYLTKGRILSQELAPKQSIAGFFGNLLLQYRMALASVIMVGLTSGAFIFAQGALPGDALYPVKKMAEKGATMLAKNDQKPAANLQLAEKRLEELNKISQKNLVQNLPTAIKEYKDAKATAKKEMASLVRQNPEQAGKIAKQMGATMKSMDAKERLVSAALGIEDEATSTRAVIQDVSDDQAIVQAFIDNSESSTLADDQKNDLIKVKGLYDNGRYEEALAYYLGSSLIN
jgi:hypothetical protein